MFPNRVRWRKCSMNLKYKRYIHILTSVNDYEMSLLLEGGYEAFKIAHLRLLMCRLLKKL